MSGLPSDPASSLIQILQNSPGKAISLPANFTALENSELFVG
ncbi:hypothetical protein ALO95_04779 [Pseudomonas syringae pv. antirrhini]|uniref:Uncharacterized protein n=2 Tax=Pseudomonas syringae group TaxID=136849 RepID=A0A0Q0G2T3_PSESX|nr:Uncharacterized protein ALO88_04952 [Pseudomonas syringae pv. antirrhini]KPZ07408.1 Uncharacterized protein ALO94_05426 [Pseudomonas syringae pv. spinaceae]RMP32508.1 hypothetical protein ALQ24_05157 [Pseudomonas syringae pv. antirrhini]RMP44894.1 hypothetical protein ALQ23_05552 [Pseudomonas syringae pv. antirrhini]RMT36216.1 hypothetical protein ALP50_05541 [Pseudomonas syringae pv. spinaceae]